MIFLFLFLVFFPHSRSFSFSLSLYLLATLCALFRGSCACHDSSTSVMQPSLHAEQRAIEVRAGVALLMGGIDDTPIPLIALTIHNRFGNIPYKRR